MTLIQRANWRTMDNFLASVARCTPGRDCWDHSRARGTVMNLAFLRRMNLTNPRSVCAGSLSLVPRARRAATYSIR